MNGLIKSVFFQIYAECNIQETKELILDSIIFDIDISLRFNHTIDIHDFAEKNCMSVSTFSKHFKTYFNMSFKKYISQQKLIYGSELLINTELTISKIAEKLKYSDCYTFTNLFKKSLIFLQENIEESFLTINIYISLQKTIQILIKKEKKQLF